MHQPALRYRQIHLDYHTSPDIPGVGADFDPDHFADTLTRAHVDSVTTFARCHHGHIYYQSKQHPERIHPNLARPNLLPDQIEACHRRGIRVPIYTTVQWDEYTADEHRDWLLVNEEGQLYSTKPLDAGFYRFCDVLHPGYRQFLKDHTRELFEMMPVDGLFFDIVQPRHSLARHWLDAMDIAGFDPEDSNARQRFAARVIDEWKLEMTEFIKSLPQYTEACTIFYNAGHVGPRHRPTRDAYTHYEIESLPSGGWGYLHFPLTARYVRGMGKDSLGMTGKFHTAWGDFHSYKNPAALEFECLQMLAVGSKCSVGDQLHPSGVLDPYTYELIGEVYAQVERKQPWCDGAAPVSEIGVFTPEEFGARKSEFAASAERQPDSALGAVRMLQELHHQFDMISTDRDLSPYRLLILPDSIPVDEALAARLRVYLDHGGAILASHESGLKPDEDAFALDAFGVAYVGQAPYSPDFLVPGDELREALKPTGHVMYERGLAVRAHDGARVLAEVEIPYFNRTWRHFCSHRHTPSAQTIGYPGVIENGRVIYFTHPVFKQYRHNAPRWCKQLVQNAIDRLMPQPLVSTNGPSSLLTALSDQQQPRRRILHALHYIPERRGQAFDTVEDIIPLHDTRFSVAVDGEASGVSLVPESQPVDFTQDAGRVTFTVPRIEGHAMIEIAMR